MSDTDRLRNTALSAGGEASTFTGFCSRNRIEYIVASARGTSTIGKTEAFHKAYKYEARLFPSQPPFVNY